MATAAIGWRPQTATAIEAAGQALRMSRGEVPAGSIRRKDGRDVVTDTDIEIEDMIRGRLGELPGATVVGEERGGQAPADGAYWLVDPICGTRNFASGIPLYCVNLALVEEGQVSVAVVADGSAGLICVAERGRGAWALTGPAPRRLAASRASTTVVIGVGRGDPARRERAALCFAAAILADRWDLRTLGTSLSLLYLAAGRVAGFVLFSGSAVHLAAGSLLASEAGASVSGIDGEPWTLESDSIIASADTELHRELLALAAGSPGPG